MSFLTIEQSISLLPSQFENIVKCPGRRPIYSSSMGNLYFRGSKDFGYMHKTWWYSIDPEIIKNKRIAYIVLAADVKGIFIIPSSVFFAYRERHPVGAVKGGREDFTILIKNKRYIRHEAKCEDMDLTRFFIPIRKDIKLFVIGSELREKETQAFRKIEYSRQILNKWETLDSDSLIRECKDIKISLSEALRDLEDYRQPSEDINAWKKIDGYNSYE